MKIKSVFVLDKDGNHITTVADNFKTKEKLMEIAKAGNYEGAVDYIYSEDGTDMMKAFEQGKIYSDGAMVDAPVVEPSAVELKMTAIAAIKAKYEAEFKVYETSLIRARLANNEAQVTKIQEQYEVSRNAMTLEIAGA